MEKKVYYHDTDCGGVVYYANYLKYFEEARTHFFEQKGYKLTDLLKQGIQFVVRDVSVEYLKPAKYGDALTIKTEAKKAGNTGIMFFYEVLRKEDNALLVKGSTRLICVDLKLKPRRLPAELEIEG